MLACAARLDDTICLPEALWAPRFTWINYNGDDISKYFCASLTVIIDFDRKINKIRQFLNSLMRNYDVIIV